jgi:predicted PurR-regulated permease PerM
MENQTNQAEKNSIIQTVVDVTIKLGVLLLLLAWCFKIIYPFVSIVLWALIIAVAIFPLFKTMSKKMGNSKKISATIITLVFLSIIIIPGILFTSSLVDGVKRLSSDIDNKSFYIAPPPEEVAEWPLVGGTIYGTWKLASESLEDVVTKYESELLAVGNWVLSALMGTGIGLIQFILSVIIAGVFLASSDSGGKMLRRFYRRLVGERGEEFAKASEITVRNVAKGVLGVSVIQSFLAGIVFLLAGIPYAGLWALICLILCVIQLGPGLVIIPVIVYLFATTGTWIAILWTIALVVVMISDNILKPLLMGKGAPVPMLVIFLGSIGGFITSGFIGLFIGAIILSLGYKLFIAWLEEAKEV